MTREEILALGPDRIYWCAEPIIEGDDDRPVGLGQVKIKPDSYKRLQRGDDCHFQVCHFNEETGELDDDTNATRLTRAEHLYLNREEVAARFVSQIFNYLENTADELAGRVRFSLRTGELQANEGVAVLKYLDEIASYQHKEHL